MENLKKIRKDKGLTQKEVADAINITQTCLANYESGRNYPDVQILKRLCDFFGVTADYLLDFQLTKYDVGYLTEQEQSVLTMLETLTPRNLKIAEDYIDSLLEEQGREK